VTIKELAQDPGSRQEHSLLYFLKVKVGLHNFSYFYKVRINPKYSFNMMTMSRYYAGDAAEVDGENIGTAVLNVTSSSYGSTVLVTAPGFNAEGFIIDGLDGFGDTILKKANTSDY